MWTRPAARPAVGSVVQPVALYDVLLVSALLAVLLVFRRRRRAPGSAVALFAAWYATDRLLLDFLRTDRVRAVGMTGTQLASLAVLGAVAAWIAARSRRTRARDRTTTVTPVPSAT